MIVRAIETKYKGCRFRSRLEARWAVFFDAAGVEWEYEKEGFSLPSGSYLPDFWLPRLDSWAEIKGQPATDRERRLARELATATGKNVFLLDEAIAKFRDGEADGQIVLPSQDGYACGDNGYLWCECEHCGAVDFQFEARSDRMACRKAGKCEHSWHGDKGYAGETRKLAAAFEAALSARFEHGETPRIGR